MYFQAIIILLISFCAFSQYAPSSLIGSDIGTIYRLEKDCLKNVSDNETCIKLPKSGYNKNFYTIQDVFIDDKDSPIWGTRSMIGTCSGEVDCKQKALELECVDGRRSFYNEEYSEVWCNKEIGYNQVATGEKVVAIDETLKAAFEASQALEKAQKEKLASKIKDIDFGKNLIAQIAVSNEESKSLSAADLVQVNQLYGDFKGLLQDGSINSAKEVLEGMTPDGTYFTESDKTMILAKINEYLGL